jgi:hypothetical protein
VGWTHASAGHSTGGAPGVVQPANVDCWFGQTWQTCTEHPSVAAHVVWSSPLQAAAASPPPSCPALPVCPSVEPPSPTWRGLTPPHPAAKVRTTHPTTTILAKGFTSMTTSKARTTLNPAGSALAQRPTSGVRARGPHISDVDPRAGVLPHGPDRLPDQAPPASPRAFPVAGAVQVRGLRNGLRLADEALR